MADSAFSSGPATLRRPICAADRRLSVEKCLADTLQKA
jgi:hypothetical protein